MGRSRRVELIEIPTEQLSYVPGPPVDRFAALSRWSAGLRDAVVAVTHSESSGAATTDVPIPQSAGVVGTASFRRLIDVPGGRLAAVLGTWWRHAPHDDRHLRLGAPRPVGNAWVLRGALRRTVFSRWVPVDVVLTPYFGPWTMLELMPRRTVHPGEIYFRAGHRSLDRFVATLRAHEALASRARSPGLHCRSVVSRR